MNNELVKSEPGKPRKESPLRIIRNYIEEASIESPLRKIKNYFAEAKLEYVAQIEAEKQQKVDSLKITSALSTLKSNRKILEAVEKGSPREVAARQNDALNTRVRFLREYITIQGIREDNTGTINDALELAESLPGIANLKLSDGYLLGKLIIDIDAQIATSETVTKTEPSPSNRKHYTDLVNLRRDIKSVGYGLLTTARCQTPASPDPKNE
jgi:hypothetical protein